MYKQITTPAIVLSRTNFNEVDRIVNFLTPYGQFTGIVKGVRKVKSRLVGGIELFSVSQITYLDTNKEIKRVVRTNLVEHYGAIAKNLERMLFAYDCMKLLKKITPESTDDVDYYLTLKTLLASLNDDLIQLELVKLWWTVKLLELSGHALDLNQDAMLKPLFEQQSYTFEQSTARLVPSDEGLIDSKIIKILRLFSQGKSPLNFTNNKSLDYKVIEKIASVLTQISVNMV